MAARYLPDGTHYVKARNHTDIDLKGDWDIYIKIDGVRVIRNSFGAVVSREGKPLYNCDHLEFKDAECFRTDWNTSVSLVRTQSYVQVNQEDIYELTDGNVDPRLYLGTKTNPTNEWLQRMMEKYVAMGHEGIVIRKGVNWLKVVPLLMADVRVLGMTVGKGKYEGIMGSISTAHGKVGSVMKQEDVNGNEIGDLEFRRYLWEHRHELHGKIIQVGYREKTEAGKLRFPKFVRIRWDKTEESLD